MDVGPVKMRTGARQRTDSSYQRSSKYLARESSRSRRPRALLVTDRVHGPFQYECLVLGYVLLRSHPGHVEKSAANKQAVQLEPPSLTTGPFVRDLQFDFPDS